MAIQRRQYAETVDRNEETFDVALASDTLPGSTVVVITGTLLGASVIDISTDGESTFIPMATGLGATGDVASEVGASGLQVEIWVAFNAAGGENNFGVTFDSATTTGVVFVAEYTGDVFGFAEPADRVASDDGQTVGGPTQGTIDTGSGGTTREDNELWVGAILVDQDVELDELDPPFGIIDQYALPVGAGRFIALDAFTSSAAAARLEATHDDATDLYWVAVMGTSRGNEQTPSTEETDPSSNEPVTENEDHASSAIALLLEQFKSHDRR